MEPTESEKRNGQFDRRNDNLTELEAVRQELSQTREAVEQLTIVVATLASKEEVEAVDTKTTKKTRKLWIAVALIVLAVIAISSMAVSNYFLVRESRKTNERIEDCTTPTKDPAHPHVCFEQGTQRSREAIDQIVHALKGNQP